MTFLNNLKRESVKTLNTKGGITNGSSLSNVLDYFNSNLINLDEEEIIKVFKKSLKEDKNLTLKVLLQSYDIREGKGERKPFLTILKYLYKENSNWNNVSNKELNNIIKSIPILNRWSLMFEILSFNNIERNNENENFILKIIKNEWMEGNDLLFWKWIPSTNNKNNKIIKNKIKNYLHIKDETYRKKISFMRKNLNLVETNLTNKTYENINYEKVPSKANLKYNKAFLKNDEDRRVNFLQKVNEGKAKKLSNNYFSYEIIKKIYESNLNDENVILDLNTSWKSQKTLFESDDNILVIADTSGSMGSLHSNRIKPIHSSLGLAFYISEKNKGLYKNNFLIFGQDYELHSFDPSKGIVENVDNAPEINNRSTNILKVFEGILNSYKNNELKKEDIPTYIIVLSDMEFDNATNNEYNETSFELIKNKFNQRGVELPIIVFWNLDGNDNTFPVLKDDIGTVMLSGNSFNMIKYIFEGKIDELTPLKIMDSVLQKYNIYFD